ncbi:ABC transporter ATP-binding protein [Streptomyces sp. NPDC008141]|uniref:ABC transporter ATP-binding protein n=1 Tax=Streptomyces sp. NPDC008141 TaxID=3364815 RepID=UPI0036E3E7B9
MAYKRPRPSGTDSGGRVPTGGAHRLLRAAVRRSATRTAAILLCSVASAGAAVASPAVVGHTLDLLLDRQSNATSWVVLSAVLLTAEVFLDAAVALLTGVTNARSTAWLRTGALGRLLATSPDRASPLSPGDVATRLSVNATEAGTVPAAAAALSASLLGPAGAVIALLFIDVWVALAFLAGLPLLVLVLRAFARNSSDTVGRYQQIQSDIASRLLEALDGARTIAAAGIEDRERARVLQPLAGLDREGRRMWRIHGRAVANSQVLLPLLTTAVLGVGGIRLAAGAISVGELLAASRYAALAAGMGALAGLLGAIVRGRSAAARLAVLQDLPAVRHGEGTLPHEGNGTVELRGVTVVREGRTVLTDVHLVVPGGKTAAVVGRSGAGKSTLAAVAGLLTEPDEGRVLLDGVPLDSLARDRLRQEVAYAFERPVFLAGTVADAIASGARRASADEIRTAARAAGADGFVQLLPERYDSPVVGAPLSGGERQRLGLARAFAHAGRLLILDDATSSLDTATERQVDRALAQEVRPGTRLVVAHRISSASRADLVIWLEEGGVRAVGRHRDLWQDPAYRSVFAASEAPCEATPEAPADTAPAPQQVQPPRPVIADVVRGPAAGRAAR